MQAYFRRRATVHDVFRSLTTYRNWLVPVPVLENHVGRRLQSSGAKRIAPGEFPPGELWLFTDGDAAGRAAAAGCRLGPYATGLPGVELFASLTADLAAVRVNPVSPAELTWNLPHESFDIARAWAKVIRFEERLADAARGATLDAGAVAAYPQFYVFVFPNRTVLTMPEHAGMVNPAVVCTAPDCAKAILQKVPERMRAELQVVMTTGRELVDKLPEQGMDGLTINPAGPGPRFPLRLTPR